MSGGETPWTKGPWKVSEDVRGTSRVFADGQEIVRALSTHGPRRLSEHERAANRRLIAAAPEMAETLAEFVLHYAGFQDGDGEPCPTVDKAEALLTRIKGSTHD